MCLVKKMPTTPILDSLELIEKIDKNGMLQHCLQTAEYSKNIVEVVRRITLQKEVRVSKRIVLVYGKPRNVVVAGMGGSAIGGELLRDWLKYKAPVPIEVCRDYFLPAYANEDTLVFAVSYSGNTEETLSAFVDAIKRKCMVITVTSGGRLFSFSKKLHVPCIKIPEGLPPRASLPYLFFPLVIVMEKLGVISNTQKEISEAIEVLNCVERENSPEVLTDNNAAKKLALKLKDAVPVVYGFREYGAVAHRWKTQLNENSKSPSAYDVFPELNHNEVVGWEAPKSLTEKFSVILLRDDAEPPEIKHRIEATKLLVFRRISQISEVYAVGKSTLAKMLYLLHFGDFVSVFLAVLRKVDPTPVKTINAIKKELTKRFDMKRRLEAEVKKILAA